LLNRTKPLVPAINIFQAALSGFPTTQARLTPNVHGGSLIMPKNQPLPKSLAGNSHAYQEALDDFGITDLLEKLSHFKDANFEAQWLHLEPEELDSLAAILIQQLTNSLNGKLISGYLNTIRHGNSDVFSSPISLEFPSSVSLPSDFPDGAQIASLLVWGQSSLSSSRQRT
jgi:hypothetical protein